MLFGVETELYDLPLPSYSSYSNESYDVRYELA